MRSMVEGYAVASAAYDLLYPSTTLRVVPLPPWGRIALVRKRSLAANRPNRWIPQGRTTARMTMIAAATPGTSLSIRSCFSVSGRSPLLSFLK